MRRAGLVILILTACGGTGGSGPPDGPYVRFEVPNTSDPVPFAGIPYPNDVLRDPTTGSIQSTPESLPFNANANDGIVQNIVEGLAAANGFGVTTGAIFPLGNIPDGDSVDPYTLNADTAYLVDLADGSIIPVTPHVRVVEKQIHLALPNGAVLQQAHTYAFLLRAGITLASGTPLVANPALTDALSGRGSPRANTAYVPLSAYLTAQQIGPDRVVGAAVFTTASYDDTLSKAREVLHTTVPGPPGATVLRMIERGPDLDDFLGTPADDTAPGWDNAGGIAHADIDAIVVGTFHAPSFQSSEPNQLGTWELDGAGAPTVKGDENIPFLLVIPSGADISNLPVIIFQHGLNASRAAALAVANRYAAAGYATFAMDLPFHGDRYPEAHDYVHNFTGASGPDGLADESGTGGSTLFFDVVGDAAHGTRQLDARVISDSFRQAAADIMWAVHLLRAGDWTPVGTVSPRFDGLAFDADHIVYTSESFGSIIGATVLAYEPDLRAAVLSVGGGGLLLDLLENSPGYWPIFGTLTAGMFGLSPNEVDPLYDPPHTHIAFLLMQQLLEPGDPLVYARHVVSEPFDQPKNVVLLAAYSDEAVPNQSGEALASALGLSWVQTAGSSPGTRYLDPPLPTEQAPVANNAGNVTAAFLEVDPATHGMLTHQRGERQFEIGFPPFDPLAEPLPIDNPIDELLSLVISFADSYLAGQPAVVIDPFLP